MCKAGDMKIIVLNLERSIERRNVMRTRLEGLPFEIEFLSAIDGKLLHYDSLPDGTEKRLAPGEIGTYLSHVKAWQTVVEQNLECAVILEDDVLLEPSFPSIVNELCQLDFRWDAIRLSALMPIKGISLCSLSDGTELLLPNKNPSGCQGYLVNKPGAERLISRLSIPLQPIDNAFDRYWKYGLYIPIISPSVVCEDRTITSTVPWRLCEVNKKGMMSHLRRVAEAELRKIYVFFMASKIKRKICINCHS